MIIGGCEGGWSGVLSCRTVEKMMVGKIPCLCFSLLNRTMIHQHPVPPLQNLTRARVPSNSTSAQTGRVLLLQWLTRRGFGKMQRNERGKILRPQYSPTVKYSGWPNRIIQFIIQHNLIWFPETRCVIWNELIITTPWRRFLVNAPQHPVSCAMISPRHPFISTRCFYFLTYWFLASPPVCLFVGAS